MASLMIENMEVKKDLLADSKYQYLFSVEEVNKLVNAGMPFRDAYKKIGLAIEAGNFAYTREVKHTHEGSIGNLCTSQIAEQMNIIQSKMGAEKLQACLSQLLK
jgi:argininosuccinate lyase